LEATVLDVDSPAASACSASALALDETGSDMLVEGVRSSSEPTDEIVDSDQRDRGSEGLWLTCMKK
jgi:hypothetical protein